MNPALAISQDIQLETRVALLDAAERLFSQNGIEGTSVREISKAAGANLGAINYHFGTKDRLALEVFARRLKPINRERIARLDALETAAGKGKLTIPQIVEALVRPAVESEEVAAGDCMRLISRCFQEPNPEVKKFVEEEFAEVTRRFDSALARAYPDLPPSELFWRTCFLHGALHYGVQKWLLFDQIHLDFLHPDATKPDREGLIQSLITFLTSGLSAPVSPLQ